MIWMNGRFIDRGAIDPADRGFVLGDGVFETILLVCGVPAFLCAHLGRLRAALAALKINTPISEADISAAIEGLYARVGGAHERASVRLTVTRGPARRGLGFDDHDQTPPTILLTLATPDLSVDQFGATPGKIMVSKFIRSEASITARHKTLNYLDNIMARREAHEAGADEAIMVNNRGRPVCATSANLFLINFEGRVSTPPLGTGPLPGVVRGVLIEAAATAASPIAEEAISRDGLADMAVFLTNSLIGLRRFAWLGVGGERSGETSAQRDAFHKLQSLYQRALDEDIRARAALSQLKGAS